MKKLVMLCLLLAAFLSSAGAVTTQAFADVGGGALTDALDGQTQRYLNGVQPENADDLSASLTQLVENAADDGRAAVRQAMGGLLRAAAIVLLTAAARGFSGAAGGKADPVIDMAGALACAAVLLGDFTGVLQLCRDTFERISVFSAALQPVLAAVLCAGGSPATATTLQTVSMLVFDLIIRLITGLLVPAACAYLAVAAVDAAAGSGLLHGLADGIKSLTAGALKLIVTLFTAYLAVAGGLSGSVDRLTLKTAKFAVSGAVPVVGGVISDATETMLSGALLLKNTVGVFGMLCVTAICLLPFLQAGAGYLCYRAGAALLSPLCSKSLSGLLAGVGSGYGLLLGMLSACSVILYLELVYMIAVVKPL